jgi:hypothetical protein
MNKLDNKNIIGNIYNRLTVVKYVGVSKHNKKIFLFKCICGNECEKIIGDVKSGRTKSCGCLNKENKGRTPILNPRQKNPLYPIWNNMMARCYNEKSSSYYNYGKLGITVCDDWHNFDNFCKSVGLRPSKKHSIDRINNYGNYEPNNCRWATHKEQCRNKKNNKMLFVDGISKPLSEWAEIYKINPSTIEKRMVIWGWNESDAVKTKVIKGNGGIKRIKYSEL